MKKLTQKEVQKRIDIKQEGQYELLGNYKNKDSKVLIRCRICGIEWKCIPNTLFRSRIGKGCKHHINMTYEMVSDRIFKSTNNTIKFIGTYKGARTPSLMHCNKCGYEWETEPYVIYAMGFGCPSCSGMRKKDTQLFRKQIKKLVGLEYSVLGEYVNSTTLIKFRHNKCGYEFNMTPHAFLAGQRCTRPEEVNIRRTAPQIMTLTQANDLLKSNRNGEYVIIANYSKATSKATIMHTKCGKTFSAKPSPIIHNVSGCPYCYASHGEDAVRQYLLDNDFSFEEQYTFDDCVYKRRLPFDFAVFKDNHLMFLIEYQGVQHYKPKFGSEVFKLTKIRDQIKKDYCESHGIILAAIPYKRWYSFDSLKSQIYSYLNNFLSHVDPEPSPEGNSGKA